LSRSAHRQWPTSGTQFFPKSRETKVAVGATYSRPFSLEGCCPRAERIDNADLSRFIAMAKEWPLDHSGDPPDRESPSAVLIETETLSQIDSHGTTANAYNMFPSFACNTSAVSCPSHSNIAGFLDEPIDVACF